MRNSNTLILYTTDALIIWKQPPPSIKPIYMNKSFLLCYFFLNFSLKNEPLYLSKKAFSHLFNTRTCLQNKRAYTRLFSHCAQDVNKREKFCLFFALLQYFRLDLYKYSLNAKFSKNPLQTPIYRDFINHIITANRYFYTPFTRRKKFFTRH